MSNIGFFFFFSSRRRHTRFSRDWSSDVCSSDLALGEALRLAGDLDGARDLLRLSLGIAREIRDDHAESLTLRRLGITYSELGQHDEARVCLTDALVMARATGRP